MSRGSGGGAFVSLRSPDYRTLWLGGLFVFLAVTAQTIARGWLALRLTGTNAGLGGVLLAFGVPSLVLAPWGGVVADRLPKRRVLVLAGTVLTLSALWLGLADAFGFVEYWMLLATSAMQALAFSLFGPTRMAFTAELVERGQLANAVSLGQMSAEGMRIVGPSIAGLLIALGAFGEKAVFLGTAGLCAVATVVNLWLPPGLPSPHRPTRSPLEDLREGFGYVRRQRHLLILVVASLGVVMIGYPYLAFLPAVASDLFGVGAGAYGLMSAVTSVGAVVAAFVGARVANPDLWRRLVVAGIAFGLGIVVLGVTPVFAVGLVVLPAIGAASLMFQTSNQSLLLMLSDFDYHGRLQGLVMLGFSGFGIAALPLGILADAIGLRPTLAGMGLISAAIVGWAALAGRREPAFVERDIG
ncbi:MAG: MFS transporter [Actinomycetota bacterium]